MVPGLIIVEADGIRAADEPEVADREDERTELVATGGINGGWRWEGKSVLLFG